jgi:hypothetical protein
MKREDASTTPSAITVNTIAALAAQKPGSRSAARSAANLPCTPIAGMDEQGAPGQRAVGEERPVDAADRPIPAGNVAMSAPIVAGAADVSPAISGTTGATTL